MSESTALAVGQQQAVVQAPARAGGLLRPIAPTGEIIAAQNEVRAFIASALEKGRDYGVIPGTGDKATLLKPGAERICVGFGVRVETEIVASEVGHDREVPWTKRKKKWGRNRGEFTWETEQGVSYGLYRYVVRVLLVRIDSGEVVGTGVGAASTVESKYVDRPRDSENTVLKMAKKRGLIDATLTTFGLSDQFTQDLEDFRGAASAEQQEIDISDAVVLAGAAQLADLRDAARKVGRKMVEWLEGVIEKGIAEDAVPRVFAIIQQAQEAKDQRAAAKRQQQQAEAAAPVADSADPMADVFG